MSIAHPPHEPSLQKGRHEKPGLKRRTHIFQFTFQYFTHIPTLFLSLSLKSTHAYTETAICFLTGLLHHLLRPLCFILAVEMQKPNPIIIARS